MNGVKEYLSEFMLYVQFLTRIPINRNLPCEMSNFKRGIMFFPVIGIIIGSIQWIIYFLLSKIMPINIVPVFIIVASLLLTGALHVDGFGDVFDGFFSFKGGKEKIIEVMKDSRIGTYSCIAIVINILLKYIGYFNLIVKGKAIWIIIIPVIAKVCVVTICYFGKKAKLTGSGNVFIENVGLRGLILSFIVGVAVVLPVTGAKYFSILAILNLFLTFLINKFCNHYIGGHTGDTLGFTSESIEIFTLIIMSAI
ncbi:adenosylcobinamide-GDP ribazoletransferase [Haloimpatiens sp. FM7315]|uniref:adenosylcobinamide-GDP ribazoletransferase n=1 Tax=Haloimpatiens sp. FM7315 TaxID=3298609 RepID=UPI003977B0D4